MIRYIFLGFFFQRFLFPQVLKVNLNSRVNTYRLLIHLREVRVAIIWLPLIHAFKNVTNNLSFYSERLFAVFEKNFFSNFKKAQTPVAFFAENVYNHHVSKLYLSFFTFRAKIVPKMRYISKQQNSITR